MIQVVYFFIKRMYSDVSWNIFQKRFYWMLWRFMGIIIVSKNNLNKIKILQTLSF